MSRLEEERGWESGARDGCAVTWLVLRVYSVMRLYAGFFQLLPVFRLVVILIRNHFVARRNERRVAFVRTNL